MADGKMGLNEEKKNQIIIWKRIAFVSLLFPKSAITRYSRRPNPSNVHINRGGQRFLPVYRVWVYFSSAPFACNREVDCGTTRGKCVWPVWKLHDCVRVQNENFSSALTFSANAKEVLTIARWKESIFTVWRSPIVTVLFIAVSRFELRSTQGHAAIGPRWRKRYDSMDISSVNKFSLDWRNAFSFSSTVSYFSFSVRFIGRWIQSTWEKTAKVLDFA